MGSLWSYVVVDAIDPPRLARWWAEVLDLRILDESADDVTVGADGGGVFPQLFFIRVAERKAGKNRIHFDLRGEDQAAEVERLVDMGARHVDIGQHDVSWVVLADPEGNEFCVLSGRRPDRPE